MIYLVAGTRPNFMKIAPIRRAIDARRLPVRMVHTGQHYDSAMSEVFFTDLGMPAPDLTLKAGGGSHAEQTAAVLVGVERDIVQHRPGVVVVVGDVTSTLAAALAATKVGIPVVHVEAGLRSNDWSMPEEVNRVLTDRMSDLLLIPSHDAEANLRADGIDPSRIVFIGNVMIDSLRYALERPTDILTRLGLVRGSYGVATLHRPVNVDSVAALEAMLSALEVIARRLPVVFPVHPRTVARVAELGMERRMGSIAGLLPIAPLGYNDFTTLVGHSRLIATDSGGIQEETTALGIPCLTMRESTERPITVTEGTNVIVGMDRDLIAREVELVLAGRGKKGSVPEGWEGNAGSRAVDAIERLLAGSPPSLRASKARLS